MADDAAFARKVRAFYEAHNPERLDLVPEIVSKYRNQQDKLWAKLEKKYPGTATSRDDRLDFRSRAFDARAALYEPGLRPPVPNAPPLDNLSKFRPFLPHSSEYHDTRVKQGAHHVVREPSATSTNRGVALLSQVTDTLREGPHSLLWRALRDRLRVRVTLRRINSIRGVVVGHLKAFDRHMNLLLVDAAETTTPKMRNPARARPRTRHLAQVLVRGDNVVLVALEGGSSSRPRPDR